MDCGFCKDDSICNHVNGSCTYGCADGWSGKKCDKGRYANIEWQSLFRALYNMTNIFRPEHHWRDIICRNAQLVHQNWYIVSGLGFFCGFFFFYIKQSRDKLNFVKWYLPSSVPTFHLFQTCLTFCLVLLHFVFN
jgi:hypothetical protein